MDSFFKTARKNAHFSLNTFCCHSSDTATYFFLDFPLYSSKHPILWKQLNRYRKAKLVKNWKKAKVTKSAY